MLVLPSHRNQSIDLQLIWIAYQLTGFYMRATLAFNRLTSLSTTENYSSFTEGKIHAFTIKKLLLTRTSLLLLSLKALRNSIRQKNHHNYV